MRSKIFNEIRDLQCNQCHRWRLMESLALDVLAPNIVIKSRQFLLEYDVRLEIRLSGANRYPRGIRLCWTDRTDRFIRLRLSIIVIPIIRRGLLQKRPRQRQRQRQRP
jgi:hypothetical protein